MAVSLSLCASFAGCGHCQHFAPIYESIAVEAHTKMPALKVAAVNCVTHEAICTKHQVNAYPTLVFYPGEVKFSASMGHPLDKAGVLRWVQGEASSRNIDLLAHPASKAPTPMSARTGTVTGTGPGTGGTGGAHQMAFAAREHDAPLSLKNASARAALHLTNAALNAAPWLGSDKAGEELLNAAKALGIPSGDDEELGPSSMLRPRKMPRPAPAEDVLAAARYSLYHEVSAALGTAPSQAYSLKRLGALRGWLHVLHRALPHDRDGGAAATGTAELLSALHGRHDLPSRAEWLTMLEHSGFPDAADVWVGCNSSHPELHAYPCSLWLCATPTHPPCHPLPSSPPSPPLASSPWPTM
jgi:thiol-disulfide isomerase/thioredoxin